MRADRTIRDDRMTESVRDRTREILADEAMVPPSEVGDDRRLEDLGLDSMALVEAIFAIEETFDIEVPFNANTPQGEEFDVSSVGAILDAVERLVAEKRT